MFLFWKILFAEFVAEMGDKTQLMLVGLTSRYKLSDIILGTALAILALNGIAVLTGGLFSALIPLWVIRLIAGAAFLFFAISFLRPDEDEEEGQAQKSRISFAPISIFCTFFVAELGDKTQLTAITFGANEGMNAAVIVWLACSLGLFAADIVGLMIGYLLQKNAPDKILNILSYFIFALFGNITLHQGLELLLGQGDRTAFYITMGIAVSFVIVSIFLFIKKLQTRQDEITTTKKVHEHGSTKPQ